MYPRIGGLGITRQPRKGRKIMFGSKFQSQLVAAFAALLMSTVAVSAAVGPASVSNPVVATYA